MSYEVRIGLLAAICIAVTVWGYKFMKGKNILNASNIYYVEYADVDELTATSPVQIRGLRVGTVSEIRLSDDMQTVIATLDIDKDIRIAKNTEALVVNTSIMGGKAVVLDVPEPCSGDGCAKSGDYLQGRVMGLFESMLGGSDADEYVEKLKKGVTEMVSSLGDTLTGSESPVAQTFQDLQTTMSNLAGITSQLERSMSIYDRRVLGVLNNIESITGNLAGNNSKISEAISNLNSLTGDLKAADLGNKAGEMAKSADAALAGLNETLDKAQSSFTQLETLLKGINQGEGTLGMLAKDPALATNLNETSRQLNLFLQDFRLNPKRYINVTVIGGKKQVPYVVPEDDPANKN